MDLGRFRRILDAYGAEPQRWPEAERAEALTLTRSSLAAARALARAQTLDDALAAMAPAETSAQSARLVALQSRIVGAAHPLAQSWTGRWFGLSLTPLQFWPSVAGLAMATILGFAVGISGVVERDSGRDADDGFVYASTDLPVNPQ